MVGSTPTGATNNTLWAQLHIGCTRFPVKKLPRKGSGGSHSNLKANVFKETHDLLIFNHIKSRPKSPSANQIITFFLLIVDDLNKSLLPIHWNN